MHHTSHSIPATHEIPGIEKKKASKVLLAAKDTDYVFIYIVLDCKGPLARSANIMMYLKKEALQHIRVPLKVQLNIYRSVGV